MQLFSKILHENQVAHGFFNRLDGVSPAPFDSLNISSTVGDDPQNVAENKNRIKALFNNAPLITMEQVHGNSVSILNEAPVEDFEFKGSDAIITNCKGALLTCKHADCQPILIYDPVHKAIGCIHNGWKGSVLNIIEKTIAAMQKQYKTNPTEIVVTIGPSLGPDHAQFINYKKELPAPFWKYRSEGDLFDFWKISINQLETCGVPKEQIELLPICTVCDSRFFSYRRQPKTGRCASVIML